MRGMPGEQGARGGVESEKRLDREARRVLQLSAICRAASGGGSVGGGGGSS